MGNIDDIVCPLFIYVRNNAHKGRLQRCLIVGVALILVIIATFKLGNNYEQISLPAQQWKSWSLSKLSRVLDTLPALGANGLLFHNATTQVNITTLTARAKDFHFSLPCPYDVYRPVSEVMQAEWVHPLLKILNRFSKRSKQVTLVLANHAYQDVLLNWLISAVVVAKPPIKNILVVALDKQLYELLQKRQVPSILVPFSSILNMKHRFSRYFETIMMIRLGFMRLINRLGFDCAMYDIDAVILKNPQPLYEKDKSDIIGSRGGFPKQLMTKWQVTICIGAVFIRSNTRTGRYTLAAILRMRAVYI